MSLPFLQKFQGVLKSSPLSDVSKTQYCSRLKRLTDITGHDIDWVIDHCEQSIEAIKKNNLDDHETAKSLCNSVLSLFKYTKDLEKKKGKQHACWLQHMNIHRAKAQEKYDTLTPSARQVEVFVQWKDILKKRDTLDKDSQEYLLLCLYTMIPPARADMNKVKILQRYPSELQLEKYPNCLVVNKDKMILIYTEFKSRTEKRKIYTKELPVELRSVIHRSLEKQPRDFLVVSPRTGQPYDKSNSFDKRFNRLLFDVFDKAVTINTLRHSFINSVDTSATPAEKAKHAKDMMHSETTFDRYRLRIPDA